MRLALLHPGIAWRDCGHCQAWQYDETSGQPVRRDGKLLPRYGPLPCRTTGCPKGTPEAPRSLHEANLAAYRHYRECRAVGDFPADAIVRRHALLIRDVEEEVERMRRLEFEQQMFRLALR